VDVEAPSWEVFDSGDGRDTNPGIRRKGMKHLTWG
jgi:hypothetical protein